MTNGSNESKSGRDQAMTGVIKWDLGMGGSHTSDILWRCDALRAGKLYNRSLFGSKEEAEQFASRMREVEPDQMFNVESVMAHLVWN